MTIAAKLIVEKATVLLNDNSSVRWPIVELVRWLNDGQREVVMHRPDAINTTREMTLVAGTRQNLDAGGLTPTPSKLIEITRNTEATSDKKAVRLISRHILDCTSPGWHGLPQTVNILHYMFDPRDPKTFYVYPPAAALAKLELMYSAFPVDIAEPALGSLAASVVGNINLPDIYANSLLDYVLYRAYVKDADFAGNAARAQSHYAAFMGALGIENKATIAVQPQGTLHSPAAA